MRLWKAYLEEPVSKPKPEASKGMCVKGQRDTLGSLLPRVCSIDQQRSPDWGACRNGVLGPALDLLHP